MSHHDEPKGNKKTTPTSDIAPGAPLWYGQGDSHHQKDFGPGYDSHDPIGLHKGKTSGAGGYGSGNAVDRFGEIGFRYEKLSVGHGSVIDIPIIRPGGNRGEFIIKLKLDVDPAGTGANPNTAIIGDYKTTTVDGFNTCGVDVDLETLNPQYNYNPVDNSLEVIMPHGEDVVNVKLLVPYRTELRKLLPEVIGQPVTYRVDEYAHLGAVSHDLPSAFISEIEDQTGCLEDSADNIVITNNQSTYEVMTLPLPSWYYESGLPDSNGKSREIDRWPTVCTPLDVTLGQYRIGKTRSIEATAYLRHATLMSDPCSANFTLHEHLTGAWLTGGVDETDFGVRYLLDDEGKYVDYFDTSTTSVAALPLSSSIAKEHHTYKRIGQGTGKIGSMWRAKTINAGDNPDESSTHPTWLEIPELDAGGDSEFYYFTPPADLLLKYGNDLTEVGHVTLGMFKYKGIDPNSMPDAALKFCVTESSAMSSFPGNFPENGGSIMSTMLTGASTSVLSAWGFASTLPKGSSLELGAAALGQWVERETAYPSCSATIGTTDYDDESVLYDVSNLSHDSAEYEVNASNLCGFYMTCTNHIDKEVYLKLEPMTAETDYAIGKTKLKIVIDKEGAYTTSKHASYDPEINVANTMKHENNTGITYAGGDGWEPNDGTFKSGSGPTGIALLEKIFDAPAPLTITPTFTGYSTQGALSANDITFISLSPGVLTSTQLAAQVAAANRIAGHVALSAFQEVGFQSGELETATATLAIDSIVGNVEIVRPGANTPTRKQYAFIDNPGDEPVTVLMDIPVDATGGFVNLPLDSTPSAMIGDASPYFHGDVTGINNVQVEDLGSGGTGPFQFTLLPNSASEVIWEISKNIIPDGTTQIYQIQILGKPIQTGTITYS